MYYNANVTLINLKKESIMFFLSRSVSLTTLIYVGSFISAICPEIVMLYSLYAGAMSQCVDM